MSQKDPKDFISASYNVYLWFFFQDIDHYGVKLPFQLKPSASGEALFAFQVSDVTFAQKLRCTLTYMMEVCVYLMIVQTIIKIHIILISDLHFSPQGTDGISSQEKLDFWLRLPCSSFMVGRLTQRETVTDLLASGSLIARSSIALENIEIDFSQVWYYSFFFSHF